MDRMNELSHGAKIVLGATIAFLIVSFFSWFHYTGPGKDELEAIGAGNAALQFVKETLHLVATDARDITSEIVQGTATVKQ